MPYKDKDREREYQRKYYQEHKEERRKYWMGRKDERCEEGRRYRAKHKDKIREQRRKRDRYRRDVINRYKQMKGCAHCGINNYRCLDIHAPDKHEFHISTMISKRRPWQAIKDELKRCIVLCANCHRIVHWKLRHEL